MNPQSNLSPNLSSLDHLQEIMTDSSHSEDDCGAFILNKPRKRWRFAFDAINSSRLDKEKINEETKKISRSPSYAVLNIRQNATDDGSHIDQKSLTDIVKEKNLELLRHYGGAQGLAMALETNAEKGIHGDDEDVGRRYEAFGSNTYKKPPAKGFFHFVLQALMHTTIVSTLFYLVFDIRQQGPKNGAYDSVSVFVAIFVIVAVSAVSNFRQSRKFDKLLKLGNNIQVDVMRDGRRQNVSIFNIVVGDIVRLKIGDQIPADGLFLDGGDSLHVDELSITGKSDHVEVDCRNNPFLLSGTKVVDGDARMLVTSVGMNTTWGKMMSSMGCDSSNDQTPLQARIDIITSYIERIALAFATLVLIVLLVRYFTGNTEDGSGIREFKGSKTKIRDVMNKILQIVAAAVTIVVVAVPEGLPVAFTIARAYSMIAMSGKLMVREVSACETMGSVTTICTDKTGTLSLNQMEVTKLWIGEEAVPIDASVTVASNVLQLLRQAVGLSTNDSVSRSEPDFSLCQTEKAILSWAVNKMGMDIEEEEEEEEQSCTINLIEFNWENKQNGVFMRKNSGNIDVHWKGAAEIILGMCWNYYDRPGDMKSMDEGERIKIGQIIQHMADERLRCIAFAHKRIPETEMEYIYDDGKIDPIRLKEDGLTLLGIVGLNEPCQQGVREAVEACRDAEVNIKLITRDDVETATARAIECGILTRSKQDMNGGEVVEGEEFQNYTKDERKDKVEGIRVMARCSSSHKLLMVQCLKQEGHVVGFIGDNTDDVSALKEADIRISMSKQGNEVVKEISDIIILDDHFASVPIALRWGRCVHNNVQKFIQFQLPVNVTTLVITFIAAVSACKVPLKPVQYLWVNLMMDTLGALGLATEKPTHELMKMRPVSRTTPLITNAMWRNLVSQALYQIAILLILQLKGESIFNVNEKVKDTLIFNTFFFCQVFNEFNARELEKKNIFRGIHKNLSFLGFMGITILLQVVVMEFQRRFVDTKVLNWGQWGACIGIAAISWPISWAIKHIPVSDKPFLGDLRWKTFL